MKALGLTLCLSTALLICALACIYKPFTTFLGEVAVLVYWMGRYEVEGIPVSKARDDFLYMSSFAPAGTSVLFEKELAELRNPAKYNRRLANVELEDDHVTAMCKTSMYTEMVTGMGSQDELGPAWYGNLDTMDPVTTEERVAMYIDACREIYKGLDPAGAQRKVLDSLRPQRAVNVTTPYRIPLNFSGMAEGLKQRYRDAFAKPDLSDRWKPQEEIGRWADLHVKHSYRPVREEIIPASEIADAVWNGKVAVFNATELLGPEIFKLGGIPKIAEMHADSAKSIPMYKQKGATAPGTSGYESLYDYAHRLKQWNKAGIIHYTEHQPWYPANITLPEIAADIRARSVHGSAWLERLHRLAESWTGEGPAQSYYHARQMLLQCALNTRRLPKLPIPSIEDALGNPDWLERAWSMFWLGPIGDCYHYDDPDNLLIGVHGDIYVTVFEQQDREVMQASMDRGCWASPFNPLPQSFTQHEQLEKDPWVKKYPFITMKLEPGMGIVVPSGAFHSLTMPSGDRVLMNVFMMPKYKGLWDAPAAKHSFYRSKFQSEEYAAMRALKLSTLYRVWDTKKIGGWFEASKLEIL